MKKFKFISILFTGLFVFGSCSDYLNVAPVSQIGSNGFYTNDAQVEAGVIAIYDGMQTMVQTEYAVTEMRSDNSKTRTSEGEGAEFESMNVSPSNSTVADYWAKNYNIIFRANTVLASLDAVSNDAKKNQFEGEAKFARAMAHFNLVRAFGDVPLILKVIGPTETQYFGRTAKSEVYAAIISDLKDAASLLPSRSGIGEGRATSGAANALLGKVYLTTGDFANAKTSLDAVKKSGDYDIVDNYHDVFYQERGKEIIFAVEFINDNSTESELFSLDFTSKGRATGLNLATNNLMNAVDPTDARKATLFYYEAGVGLWECGKYLSNSSSSSLSGNDWIVLRYADVLLMEAEAIMGNNTSTTDLTALDDFNAIRTRAGLSTVETLTKDMLVNERRIEFAFEDQRLYDLVRLGYADSVMGAFSQEGEPTFAYHSTALLLPIPQRERNLYSELTQNPGYSE